MTRTTRLARLEARRVQAEYFGTHNPREKMEKLYELPNELPNGYHLYVKPNQVGGRSYYTDENVVLTLVWDTAIIALTTLRAVIEAEERANDTHEAEQRGECHDRDNGN